MRSQAVFPKNPELFFKDDRLPFVEARYAHESYRLFKPHLHQSLSIGAVSQGSLTYQIAENQYTLGQDSLAIINPETLHSCNPDNRTARSYYMLYLNMDWCVQVQQSLWQVEQFVPLHCAILHDHSLFLDYIAIMKQLLVQTTEPMEQEQSLIELMTRLFMAACPPGPVPSSVASTDVERLKQELSTNLDQELTLSRLAQQWQQNPYTLLRKFKRTTGVTPHAYRLNCRIETARRLLQQGQDIADTAYSCGFCDQSHFHRTFKAMTTVTPQEYQLGLCKRQQLP